MSRKTSGGWMDGWMSRCDGRNRHGALGAQCRPCTLKCILTAKYQNAPMIIKYQIRLTRPPGFRTGLVVVMEGTYYSSYPRPIIVQ